MRQGYEKTKKIQDMEADGNKIQIKSQTLIFCTQYDYKNILPVLTKKAKTKQKNPQTKQTAV